MRNPFTFGVDPVSGKIYINNVGENSYEEINHLKKGANYGWPDCEGPQRTGDPSWPGCNNSAFTYPIYSYLHTTSNVAITGGAFYRGNQFPSEYYGNFFFSDYAVKYINRLDNNDQKQDWRTTGVTNPVDLKVGSDGALYYLTRIGTSTTTTNSIRKISYVSSSQPPSIASHPLNATATVGGSATFTVSVAGSTPLSYQWQRNGADISGATNASYTISNVQSSDNGAQFRVVVTNAYGTATSNPATLTVTSNQAPVATINTPLSGTLYNAGDSISYSGTGTDNEDGSLPASAFTWSVEFYHSDHIHPFIQATSGATGGTFTIPTVGEVSDDVWYRIFLTVTDSQGLTHTTQRDVTPRKADITLNSNIAGIQLTLDAQPKTLPHTVTGVVGLERTLGAASPQTVGGQTYQFVSWSDSGAQNHTISTPSVNTTYTANFQSGCPNGDVNGDCRVGITDLSILLSNWSSTTRADCDFNRNGVVDIFDLSILLSNYGR
jgi:hypothetical protein